MNSNVIAFPAPTVTAFEVGKTYQVRAIGDHECVFSYVVVSRTASRITIRGGVDAHKAPKVVGVKVWEGVEQAFPEGRYSMAPVIKASRQTA